jgi:hypothetical protein
MSDILGNDYGAAVIATCANEITAPPVNMGQDQSDRHDAGKSGAPPTIPVHVSAPRLKSSATEAQ